MKRIVFMALLLCLLVSCAQWEKGADGSSAQEMERVDALLLESIHYINSTISNAVYEPTPSVLVFTLDERTAFIDGQQVQLKHEPKTIDGAYCLALDDATALLHAYNAANQMFLYPVSGTAGIWASTLPPLAQEDVIYFDLSALEGFFTLPTSDPSRRILQANDASLDRFDLLQAGTAFELLPEVFASTLALGKTETAQINGDGTPIYQQRKYENDYMRVTTWSYTQQLIEERPFEYGNLPNLELIRDIEISAGRGQTLRGGYIGQTQEEFQLVTALDVAKDGICYVEQANASEEYQFEDGALVRILIKNFDEQEALLRRTIS